MRTKQEIKPAVNLTALAEARAKMTPGEWCIDEDGEISAFHGPDGSHVGPCDFEGRNTTGMLAEHNAMPVLLEVVRAALRLRAAELAAVKAMMEGRTERDAIGIANVAREERLSSDAYDDALAKVSL